MKIARIFSLLDSRLKKGILIIAIFAISLPAVYQLFRPGFFPMYDDMQVIRVEQMDKCIKDWQIPCRWVPDLGYGYGYPLFEYYSPLPYYFMEGVHLLGFSFIDCVKVGFNASIVLSALFLYLLARKYFSHTTSLILAFIYVMIPFRAADVYVRGAMGEAWGIALLPAYLWSFEKFIKDRNLFSFSLFSLFGGLFLITHNLTILMSLPLLAIWFSLRLKANKKLIKYTFLSVSLSLCLASFYILPLIAERNLIHIETTTLGYFNFINHFSSLKQIFFSVKWGYGPSEVGANDDAFVGIGPIHAVLGTLGFISYLVSKDKKKLLFFSALFGFAFFYAFLMHAKSTPVWYALPFMKYFQFPWRFSLVASFLFSFLAGNLFERITKPVKPISYLAIIVIIFLAYGNFFAPKAWINITDREKLSGVMRERAVTASIYDYLPKSAKVNPADPAPDSLIIKSGEVDIASSVRGSNWYKYVINVKTDSAEVIIPAYDFPGWHVVVNNMKIGYERSGELGLLLIKLGEGKNTIYAKLSKTPLKTVSDTITLISFGMVVYCVSVNKLGRRKIT